MLLSGPPRISPFGHAPHHTLRLSRLVSLDTSFLSIGSFDSFIRILTVVIIVITIIMNCLVDFIFFLSMYDPYQDALDGRATSSRELTHLAVREGTVSATTLGELHEGSWSSSELQL